MIDVSELVVGMKVVRVAGDKDDGEYTVVRDGSSLGAADGEGACWFNFSKPHNWELKPQTRVERRKAERQPDVEERVRTLALAALALENASGTEANFARENIYALITDLTRNEIVALEEAAE